MRGTFLSINSLGIHLQIQRISQSTADSGQESLTSRKEHMDPHKTRKGQCFRQFLLQEPPSRVMTRHDPTSSLPITDM